MFKLLQFSLKGHSVLKDINIDFVENKEILLQRAPYTSVLIGVNGVGKSQILKAISEVFRQLDHLKNSSSKWKGNFHFSIKYIIDEEIFLIKSSKYDIINKLGITKDIFYYKNVPSNFENLNEQEKLNFQVTKKNLLFPNKLLVSSIMLNDRFSFAESLPTDFYQYLGIRRSPGQTSTQTFVKRTIRYIFDAAKTDKYKKGLSELLDFIGLERSLKISYSLKYKTVFEKGSPDTESFHRFFNEWWKVEGIRRSQERAPWGKWYYDKIKDDNKKINKLLNLINIINQKLTDKINAKRAKEYVISVFSEEQDFDDYSLIEELIYLDILQLNGIDIKKKTVQEYSVGESSSGEYHLLLSLLGVFSRIEQNSLILLDEPEISLHPNWQMRYIDQLKKMFYEYSSCHFIIASHSHFMVSDLKDESSSAIRIEKVPDNKIETYLLDNTYGWSAEEVLYSIFKVRSIRNSFFEFDLTKLITMLNRNSADLKEIERLYRKFSSLKLSDEDPLNIVLEKTSKYLIDKNA